MQCSGNGIGGMEYLYLKAMIFYEQNKLKQAETSFKLLLKQYPLHSDLNKRAILKYKNDIKLEELIGMFTAKHYMYTCFGNLKYVCSLKLKQQFRTDFILKVKL